jgi:hypothetical protein
MRSLLKEMEHKFNIYESEKPKRWQDSDKDGKWYEPGVDVNESNLSSTIDEPYYIEIAIRDAREALMIYADIRRNYPDITIYGSNVYASFDREQANELLYAFEQQSIEISETSLDEEELDEQNTSAAVASYATPKAFGKLKDKDIEQLGYKKVQESMDSKYEQLIESYREFTHSDPKITTERKVKNTIKDIAKRLQEIETLVNYNSRLKTESGVAASTYGSSTQKALNKISERLIKISERVRTLGE